MRIQRTAEAIHITWPEAYIPPRAYSKIRNFVYVGDYRALVGKSLLQFQKFVKDVSKRYQTDIPMECALSIRSVVLKDKVIRGYSKMNHMIGRISVDYNNKNIVELSKKYDFPPLNLLRGILLFRGFEPSAVYDVFTGKKPAATILKGRNLEQYKLALRNDAEASFNQSEIARIAAENERAVVKWFADNGISMKTQNELVAEQVKEYGRAVATPDILFTEPVYINGVRTHWLDYKDYTATEIPFIFNSNVDQSARYVEKWGPGVLCYRYVVGNVSIPNVQCLSAEYLNIKFA